MLERFRVVCFISVWGEERRGGPFFSAVSFFGVLASRLARLNCRHFLAGQFFLSGDVCCFAFVSRLPFASMGLGSKIVCSIDETGRLAKHFCDEMSSADVGSVSNMLRICKLMFSIENV